MATGTDGFSAWNYANTGTPLFYPTLAPYLALVSMLSYAIPSAGVIERLIIIVAFVASCESMYRLCLKVIPESDFSTLAAAVGGVSYAFSTYIFTKLSQGVLQEALSYALLPVVACVFLDSIGERVLWKKVAGASFTGLLIALAAIQTQYAVIAALVVVSIGFWRRSALETAIALVGAALSEAYVALPAFQTLHDVTRTFATLTPLSVIASWAPGVLDAVRQSGYAGAFDKAAVGLGPSWVFWYVSGAAVFVMALCGFALSRRRSGPYLLCATALVVFVASSPKIAPPIYFFILKHVPLALMFRESYRLLCLLAFLESLGVSLFVYRARELSERVFRIVLLAAAAIGLVWYFWFNALIVALSIAAGIVCILYFLPRFAINQEWKRIIVVGAAVAFTIGASPFVGYGLGSQIQTFNPPPSASETYRYLQKQPDDDRVLYLPFLLPLYPSGGDFAGTDPTISWAPKPSFGNYVPTRIAKQFASYFYSGDPRVSSMLADWLAIRYVDARSWVSSAFFNVTPMTRTGRFPRNPFSKKKASRALMQLGFRKIVAKFSDAGETLYERHGEFADRAVNAPPLVVAGTLKTASIVYKGGDVVAFVDQNSRATLESLLSNGATLVLGPDGLTDLSVALLPDRDIIRPATLVSQVDADQNWAGQSDWNSWWWLNRSMLNVTSDAAMIARIHDHSIALGRATKSGPTVLAIQYWIGASGAQMSLRFGKHVWTVKNRVTSQNADFRWFVVTVPGAKKGDRLILTAGKDGDAAIARAAIAPLADFRSALNASVAFSRSPSAVLVLGPGSNRVALKPATYVLYDACRSRLLGTVAIKRGTIVGGGEDQCEALSKSRLRVPAVIDAQPSHDSYIFNARAFKTAVLNTGFSSLWTISACSCVHFVADGYSNGWFAPKGLSKNVVALRSIGALQLGLLISAIYSCCASAFFLIGKLRYSRAEG